MVGVEGQRYRVLSRIGEGGFGEVYHAQKIAAGGFRKDVALKMLNAQMVGVEEVVRRLKDEARILGLLNHRAIVKVDLLAKADLTGEGSDRWTVVMEYVEGTDLKDLLKAEGHVPLFVALEIGAEVAGALDYAYNHELVDPKNPSEGRQPLHLLHRDIKPSNIQLTAHGDVKVLDFGIARAEFDRREAVTGTSVFLTREYAAPERMRGVEHPGGDVFSLGAVLVELITGQRLNLVGPYIDAMLRGTEGFLPDAYRASRTAEISRTLARVPGMSEALSDCLLSTLAWDPERRPQARTLTKALRRFAAMTQGNESLAEWCEQIVKPLVEQQRVRRAGSALPARRAASPLAGRTLVSDGQSFRLVHGQPGQSGELSLDRPTSAESIEAMRGGLAGAVTTVPSEDQLELSSRPAGAGQRSLRRSSVMGSLRAHFGLGGASAEAHRSIPMWPQAWSRTGLVLVITLVIGGALGGGAAWITRAHPERDATDAPRAVTAASEPVSAEPISTELAQGATSTAPTQSVASTDASPGGLAPTGGGGTAWPSTPERAQTDVGAERAQADASDQAFAARPSVVDASAPLKPVKRASSAFVALSGGDARMLLLLSGSQRYEVGAAGTHVPPGDYLLLAQWRSSTETSTIRMIRLTSGERVALRCVQWNKRCETI